MAASRTLDDGAAHLAHVDGVMLGRAAYQKPELLARRRSASSSARRRPCADADAVVEAFWPYVAARARRAATRLRAMTRHMLGLFHGRPGARAFRRHLATEAVKPGAGLEVLRAAAALVARGGALDRAA